MISDPERKETIRYIADRQCESGGYCHYRLDEPNAADTYFALDTLRLLDALERDPLTEGFLLRMQRPGGGYPTFYAGAFFLRSLALIGKKPAVDPRPWLLSMDPVPRGYERPVESVSVFERIYVHLDLCGILGVRPDERVRDAVLDLLSNHHHRDGGFGHPRSSLIETAHALAILDLLGEPIDRFEAGRFLRLCEHPTFGYLNIPEATPAFIEHVTAGAECAALADQPSQYPDVVRKFVGRCRNANGGYSRSIFGGISTLETTHLAIRALALIDQAESPWR